MRVLFAMLAGMAAVWPGEAREVMPLEGEWLFSYQRGGEEETVVLPGTMDEWGRGKANTNRRQTAHLSRLVTYEGEARYRKTVDIPDSFAGRPVFLHLERTKKTTLYVDEERIGSCENLQTPHRYDLTGKLTPGRHTIMIVVDNSKSHYPKGVGNSHALVEHTQTNWNGILGSMHLESCPPSFIESAMILPHHERHAATVRLRIRHQGEAEAEASIGLQAISRETGQNDSPNRQSFDLVLKPGVNEVEREYRMGDDACLWSEFSPCLYTMSVSLQAGDTRDECRKIFGMRRFEANGTQFSINGNTIFLRGKHDACVFPLTGYPPMDKKPWLLYLGKLASYGINYVRFHSWTPPEAAFEAADELGIYLQPEIPYWGYLEQSDREAMEFFRREGAAIIDAYASHPSFVMMALGNELTGTDEAMREILEGYRRRHDGILYSFGSNNHLGRKGYIKGEDFLTTCRIGRDAKQGYANHVRSSFSFADADDGGILNGCYPSARATYEQAISSCPIPVIGHETGQFQIYPDFRETGKYTGVLQPWNLMVFAQRAEKNHMGAQTDAFHRASGAWAAQCYKADIELALRTPGLGGFQLLDLQDFPGQGSAYVGLLDAFMDSKGIMEGGEFSGFCHAVVPLALFDKHTWSRDEVLEFDLQVANYGESNLEIPLQWKLADRDGRLVQEGRIPVSAGQGELSAPVRQRVSLADCSAPTRLTLSLALEGSHRENRYAFWVYPATGADDQPENCRLAERLDEPTLRDLCEGATVLLVPRHEDVKGMTVGGMATPDYWNFAMFKGISEGMKKPVSPGTLTLLADPSHPLFRDFPTEEHTNWQWWSIMKHSRPFILDGTPHGLSTLIQVVDNIERNHRLGLVFETRVGKGKLLVCMTDLDAIRDKPEGRQFRRALLRYAASADFAPAYQCSLDELKRLFSDKVVSREVNKVENPTDYR